MERKRRKRKPAEKSWNKAESIVILDDGITTAVKTEPDEDADENKYLFSIIGCVLCQVSSELQLQAIGADLDTVHKIKRCIGIEVFPEFPPTARICQTCLQELDAQHSFWKRSLQCNEYAQNETEEDKAKAIMDVPAENKVCRFCLKIGGELVDLFHNPDEELLDKIRQCFGVEMNASDAVTKICRKCIQRIDEFLAFRLKYLPMATFIKQENDPASVSGPKRIKQEKVATVKVEHQDNLNPELNDSDSVCSMEKNVQPSSSSGDGKQLSAELLELIGSDLKGRNFGVVKEGGAQLKVKFEGYFFRFFSERPNGASWWICVEAKLRNCRLKLEIDPEGRKASVVGTVKNHCHSIAPAKLLECPAGRGTVNVQGKDEPFWLLHGQQITRTLLFGGFRYFLYFLKNCCKISIWHCSKKRGASCKAFLEVEGIFQRITVSGSHNHEPLSESYIELAISKTEADYESTQAIDAFREANPLETIVDSTWTARGRKKVDRKEPAKPKKQKEEESQEEQDVNALTKEKVPEVFKLLEKEDLERNFETSETGGRFKLCENGFEFRYFARLPDESTLWKCIYDSLHHCTIIARLSEDGKRLAAYSGSRHNHTLEPEPIFRYPLGKRMVGEEPLWLLSRVSMYYENRCVIYRDYVFVLREVSQRKGVVRWGCLKKCRALLATKGNFEEVTLTNEHSHEKPSPDVIKSLIEGKSTLDPAAEDVPFRKKLLSHPSTRGQIWNEDRNEYETFYILNAICPGAKSSYLVIFRDYKYSFASVDQNGTSRWICPKTDYRRTSCRALAIVEGLFESISVKDEHNHEALSESELELMIKRCGTDLQSSERGAICLKELPPGANESNNILSMLARPDPERNFTVERGKRKLLINFEGDNYRLKSHDEEDGSSLWNCTWFNIRMCPMVLRISPDAKQAILADVTRQHNHSDEQIAIYLADCGKGSIYDEDRCTTMSYYLYSFPSEFRNNRGLIYQGYRYYLHRISNSGNSTWKCRNRCPAFARVEDILKGISITHEHNHDPLTKSEIKAATGLPKVDSDLLADSAKKSKEESPLHPSALLKVLSKPDPDRNFQFSCSPEEEMKIHQKGYDYYHLGSSAAKTHSLWRCIYFTIRNCHATVRMDNRCKLATLSKCPKHTHSQQFWSLFNPPNGQATIMDPHAETEKPIWFLMQQTFLRPCPSFIYEGNKFSLIFISESGNSSRWRCVSSTAECPAILTVNDLFDVIISAGEPHNHAPPPEEKRAEWFRLDGGGSSTNDRNADGMSAAQEDDDESDDDGDSQE